MMSWFGFGKKEVEPSVEDKKEDNLSVEQADQASTAEPIEQPVEQAPEQVISSPAVDEVEQAEDTVVEPTAVEPVADEIKPVVEDSVELTPEENLLAEVQAAEEVEAVKVETTEAPLQESEPEVATEVVVEPQEEIQAVVEPEAKVVEENSDKKPSFFARLKQGLSKTRQTLGGGLVDLFRGKQIDDDLFEELETHLLMADVGVETTMKIIDSLTQSASRKQLKDASVLYDLLKAELKKIIEDVSQPLAIPEGEGPFVMLMVGVNGVGKTTTIGKLAKQFQAQGKSVMLAAGDTFRAAAVEQLQVWGERNDIPVVAQHTGADSASVIFDAISAAKARNVDVIIADTAGRLQNKAHLMEELKKVVRVMKKLDVNAPHEVMLTLDAGTGQNALSQTKLFDEAVGLTGLTLTKLDGTAKGGVVFAIADKHNIPIRYLGVGEGIDDLRPFNSDDFIEAIFSK